MALMAVFLGACGARTGLMVDERDGGIVFDATVTDAVSSDAADAPDAPTDAGPDAPDTFMEPDAWVPPCPDSVRVSGREASIPVDTIWALDSSFSMADDLQRMRDNIESFWPALSGANIDSRTVFVAQDGYAPPPPAGFAGRFVQVNARVGSEDALVVLLDAFRFYGSRLRPDAITHIVVVTDDNSRAMDWERFTAEMELLLGHEFIFHAVASEQLPPTIDNPRGACVHTTGAAWWPGIEYYEMADATGGLKMSICEEDWSELFDQLNERVAVRVPLPCAYSLPALPPQGISYDPENFTVLANVPGEGSPRVVPQVAGEDACGGAGGWWYFEGSQRVHLCETSCTDLEALDARIEVDLGCDTTTP